jgi:hypothetical protein
MTTTPQDPLTDEQMETTAPAPGPQDADGTDGQDADGTDGQDADGTDGDSTDADGTDA